MEKAGLIGLVKLRYIESDTQLSMRGDRLAEAIAKDREKGLIPFFVSQMSSHYIVYTFWQLLFWRRFALLLVRLVLALSIICVRSECAVSKKLQLLWMNGYLFIYSYFRSPRGAVAACRCRLRRFSFHMPGIPQMAWWNRIRRFACF